MLSVVGNYIEKRKHGMNFMIFKNIGNPLRKKQHIYVAVIIKKAFFAFSLFFTILSYELLLLYGRFSFTPFTMNYVGVTVYIF